MFRVCARNYQLYPLNFNTIIESLQYEVLLLHQTPAHMTLAGLLSILNMHSYDNAHINRYAGLAGLRLAGDPRGVLDIRGKGVGEVLHTTRTLGAWVNPQHKLVQGRNKSDLAVWDLVGIPIVVKSRHYVERRDFPPLWGSPLGPIPPDPTSRA